MIPLRLRISGFLSYRDPVELDFAALDLACISGHNGAGKSSLLDAFTWALFGEARGKGADVINLSQDVKAAEVALTFDYEGNTYRVQRTLPRNKSTVLEFQVLDGGRQTMDDARWRPLTEKTTRETQARIEQTLAVGLRDLRQRILLFAGQGRPVHAEESRRTQSRAEFHPWFGDLGCVQGAHGGEAQSARTRRRRN
ncbi:MAG: SMC family ATPase [Chloroflexi bacterium]|nr:SMC family ATPase [Chloroflexota bacterium]